MTHSTAPRSTRARVCGGLALGAALVLLAPAPSGAATIVVGELGDSRGSAFDTDPYFSLPPPANSLAHSRQPTAQIESSIDTAIDVDWYAFTAQAGAAVLLDIDTGGGFDSVLSLFDANGTLVAQEDDSAPEPGSPVNIDPFIGTFFAPATGVYFAAVSGNPNWPIADSTLAACRWPDELRRPDGATGGDLASYCPVGVDGYNQEPGDTGSYTLLMSVPEPSAGLLLAGGLLGLAIRRRAAIRGRNP